MGCPQSPPMQHSSRMDDRHWVLASSGPLAWQSTKRGTVWVADGTHVRMYVPLANAVFTACSDTMQHQQPIKFKGATGIALSQGKIFVVDSGANQIMRLTPHEDVGGVIFHS
jgi:hypothetical protein